MTNEIESIDRVIPDDAEVPTPEVLCPKCGGHSLWTFNSWNQTLMAYNARELIDGQYHTHNPNQMIFIYKCDTCDTKFTVKKYFTCWCGWIGGETEIMGVVT